MIKALRNPNLLLLLYAMLIASLFFDALKIGNIASVSRTVSMLFMLSFFCTAGRQVFLGAFQSMILVALLLLYLLVRSAVAHFDPSDPYFYALFLNLLLAITVVGILQTINKPTAVVGTTFVIVAIFAICTIFGWGVERSLQDYRVTFLHLNPNEFSALLLVGLITGLCYVDSVFLKYQRSSWLYFLGFVFIILAIFSTGTRFTIIGAVLAMLIYAVRVYHRHDRPKLALLYCFTVVATFSWEIITSYLSRIYYGAVSFENNTIVNADAWGRSSVLERFDLVNTGIVHNLSSLGGRTELWLISINAFLSAPFIGQGYEGLKAFSIAQRGILLRPHNALLEAMAIGGGLVFIFVILILRWVFQRLKARNSDMEMAVLVLLPVAMISMMLNVSALKLFWVYLGICVYWFCLPQAGASTLMKKTL